MTDPRGDATGDTVDAANRPELDLLSADFKVVRGTFTAVLRLAALPETPPATGGTSYYLSLVHGGLAYDVQAFFDQLETRFTVQTGNQLDPLSPYRLTTVQGRLDSARTEVVVTGPVTAFTPDGKATSDGLFTELSAATYTLYTGDVLYAGSAVDRADTTRDYVVGRRPCF